ncbi:MAG TPA: ABC transporter permease [Dongiaceae bacterium]|jgi:putative spermidine/putrescine transport system permease protein|nr:ABC transporter permease [Dongiaceae bacterium]
MGPGGLDVPLLRRLWLYVLALAVLFYLVAPIFIVIPMSFSDSNYLTFPPDSLSLRWYRTFFGSEEWMSATRVSLTAAALTTLLATPIGTAAAYALNRLNAKPQKVFYSILLLPQILPVILVGIGVYFLYTKLSLINTLPGIVAAHMALATPFVVVTVLSGLKSYDLSQEDAARGLGAGGFRAFVDVTLPQIKPSMIAGALFAFITSLDEAVLGLFIAGGSNTVLPRKMFLALRDQIDPTIAAISTLLILISMVGMALFLITGNRQGR